MYNEIHEPCYITLTWSIEVEEIAAKYRKITVYIVTILSVGNVVIISVTPKIVQSGLKQLSSVQTTVCLK